MRCLNTNELVTNKVITISKTQKILQLKDLYNLEVRTFTCRTSILTLSYWLHLLIILN